MSVTMPCSAAEELLDPDEALSQILNSVPSMPGETVRLSESLDRVIAEDVFAHENVPSFDNSAMDGYAVIAEDTCGASKEAPKCLRVVASEAAGTLTSESVDTGTAIRIMTGAAMPRGANAVVMVEDTSLIDQTINVFRDVSRGANVRRAGEDVSQGDLVIHRGTRIGPAELGMLAALGRDTVLVSARPRVAIVTTGSEIVDVSQVPAPGQIRDSNQFSILGQVLRAGTEVSMVVRVGDEREPLRQAIEQAAQASDVVITSGGVSVGDYDLVKETLSELGDILFWRVAIKPGKPLVYGRVLGRPLFGLPGNPVSSMVSFDLFVRPALRRMTGVEDVRCPAVTGIVSQDIRHKEGRREYIRCRVSWVDSRYVAVPTADQGSARLSSMLGANAYAVIPSTVGHLKAGDGVDVLMMD